MSATPSRVASSSRVVVSAGSKRARRVSAASAPSALEPEILRRRADGHHAVAELEADVAQLAEQGGPRLAAHESTVAGSGGPLTTNTRSKRASPSLGVAAVEQRPRDEKNGVPGEHELFGDEVRQIERRHDRAPAASRPWRRVEPEGRRRDPFRTVFGASSAPAQSFATSAQAIAPALLGGGPPVALVVGPATRARGRRLLKSAMSSKPMTIECRRGGGPRQSWQSFLGSMESSAGDFSSGGACSQRLGLFRRGP